MIDRAERRERLHRSADDKNKAAETFIKLAEYHRKAMEARRTVEFQALVAALALFGAVYLKGEQFIAAANGPNELFSLRIQLTVLLLVTFGTYFFTALAIQQKAFGDRTRYVVAEARAWQLLDPARWKKDGFFEDF